MHKYISKSEEETFNIAQKIAANVKGGMVIGLVGELGVGKTHFVKGFANALGIKENIDSPTFTIVKEYIIPNKDSTKLFHFDAYRIENLMELDDIGFDEYIYSKNISIIEWADLIKERIPENAIWIKFQNINGAREIIVE